MARIFISHSSGSNSFAASVRQAVVEQLRRMGHEPLVDQELIDAGDRWRAKLLRWLGSCHGAVLLFTNEALDRDWVRAEATILGWRAWLNQAMRLVPVLLDDNVSSQSLDELGLKPVQMRDIQVLRSSDLSDTDAETWGKAIAQAFAGYQAGAESKDPMCKWLKMVAAYLRGNFFLEEAAERLGVPELDRCDIEGSLNVTVADRLLQSDAVGIERAVLELANDPDLRPKLRAFTPLVSCAWLPAEMAPILYEVALRECVPRILAVRVSTSSTATRLLARLTCCDNSYTIIDPISAAGTGEDEEGELTQRYTQKILERVGASQIPWADAIRSLRKARDKRPVFVILGTEAIETGVLGHLAARFGELVFVCAGTRETLERYVLTPARLPAVELTPQLPQVREAEGCAAAERLEGL